MCFLWHSNIMGHHASVEAIIMVQSKQPTYLSPPCLSPISAPLGCIHTCTPETPVPKSNMPATLPTPPCKMAAHPGLKKSTYLPTPPLAYPQCGGTSPLPSPNDKFMYRYPENTEDL